MVLDITRRIHPHQTYMLNLTANCFDHVRVFSIGIWNDMKNGDSIFIHPLVRFNVQLIIFVSLSTIFHMFLRRLHVPRLCSQLLAGFVIGPSFMETYFPDFVSYVFNSSYTEGRILFANNVVVSIATLGYTIFVFLAGIRMDPSMMLKTEKSAPIMGIILAVFQLMMVVTMDVKLLKTPMNSNPVWALMRLNSARQFTLMAINSQLVSVSALLMQLKITNSRLGHVALATQLTAELFSTFLDVINHYRAAWVQIRVTTGIHVTFLGFLFVLTYIFFLRPIIRYIIRNTPEDQPVDKKYTNVMVIMVLGVMIVSTTINFGPTNGPFVLGLLIPAGSPLARDLIAKLEPISSGLFIPLLLSFAGSKFCFGWFIEEIPLTFLIAMIAWFIKLFVSFSLAFLFKFSIRESLALGLIVSNKSAFEIGMFMHGNVEYKDVKSTCGFFIVFMIAAIVPPLVNILYDPKKQYIGYHKKSLQYASHHSELKILACAHRQEEAMAAIKLLECSNPTKESPLSIYGLCLEELVASATPYLIDHQLGQKTNSSFGSRSQPIIDIFKYFQSQHKKLTRVYIYTAVSPTRQMHEDICWISFEKATSLIILPFHKKWNSKTRRLLGGLEDHRTVNIEVLNRAPCSVGILIDRRGSQGLSSIFLTSSLYKIGVPFIGGNDDREALACALRMTGSAKVELTVIKLSTDDVFQDRWEAMLDNESLRNLKVEESRGKNIYFKEERVVDGSETAGIVRKMVEDLDLLIVGRRHESNPKALSGFSEWMEQPELGVIGDFLASPDIVHPVSVLVIQQQIMKASHSSILNT